MATVAEALALAVQYHQAGNLQAAEPIYRQILQVEPTNADALHLLGVLAYQVGRHDVAVAYIQQALAINPRDPAFHSNLGVVYDVLGRPGEAEACQREALRLQPDFSEAQNNLGNALKAQGRVEEALASYREALRLNPNNPGAHNNVGNVLRQQGKLAEAVASYRQAVCLQPDDPGGHHNLGNALREQGKLDEAIASCRHALQLRPDYPDALTSLGAALAARGQFDEAIACCQQAVRLQPDNSEAHNHLGNALQRGGRLDEASASYRQALRLRADNVEALNNLGVCLKDMGLLDEAFEALRRVSALRPDVATFHSNLVYTLHFHADYDAQTLAEEHRRWYVRHAEPLARFLRPHGNDPDPERRLRVGYVSPDFRQHPVGRFLLPLLEAHDRSQFEVFCYSSVARVDHVTGQLRGYADCWRDVAGVNDERLAEVIREDRIDVLVDLAAHMAGNRMLVFARKPAPVQVTYLAYCSTTGLKVMDYRLTDPFLDPPGKAQEIYSEESVWLPETYWCYQPRLNVPAAGPLPALTAGHVTFGCLNNFCKVTPSTLAAWRELLETVPDSRLLLHAHTGSHRERVIQFFGERRVDRGRLEFVGFLPLSEYFGLYDRIDVGLDPFPYAGGTTTCDALWRGVPVISLAGQTAVARAGLSILSNAGLPELVARTSTEYVRIAAGLAGDLPRLAVLRSGLRARLECSPLTDAPRFARHVEAAFRTMWRRWCAAPSRTAGMDDARC